MHDSYWSGENKRPETDDLEPMRFHHVWTKKVNVSEDYINDSYRSNWISITSIGTDKEEVFSLYRKALEMTHDNLVNQHKQVKKAIILFFCLLNTHVI